MIFFVALLMCATPAWTQVLKVPGTIDPQRQCAWIAKDRPEFLPLERACVAAVAGFETLPNFVCNMDMSRTQTKASGIASITERITGIVRFQNGEELLTDVKLNGVAVNEDTIDKSLWAEGEFSPPGLTVLNGRDSPQFQFKAEQSAGGKTDLVFEYKIDKEHSTSWTVNVTGVPYHPAFHGSLWIDRQTGVLRRVTMEVDNFDDWVPYATLLKDTEYGFVTIEGLGTYLLPTRSVSKACSRTPRGCNEIVKEFKSCRRFAAKARIVE
jgi:hypothetical protein